MKRTDDYEERGNCRSGSYSCSVNYIWGGIVVVLLVLFIASLIK
ncbi:MAG TPA: hypothetical protein VK444_01915 [Methanobacteriaceae archaeon]|nr:hypothetical protein [Methanobacteriaceae archaeon]